MTPFDRLVARAAPLLRDNVDTDAIIPSREIRQVSKTGLAAGLFAGWRYLGSDGRIPDPGFVLNQPGYRDAQILLTGANFGCGSSREHAAWALAEYGFRAIVASSFNPIFHGNCVRNGILPVVLDPRVISDLAAASPKPPTIAIDLPAQTVTAADGARYTFEIAAEAKEMLLHGLDAIDLTLRARTEIDTFVTADRIARRWAYLP